MTKPYIKVEKDTNEALDSYKYVFLMHVQGAGKTDTGLKVTSERYKHTAFMGDKHSLNDELNLTYNLSPHFFVNMFGKDFDKISPELQAKMGYPRCMCDFRNNPDYYLKKLNYLPDDWCSIPDQITQDDIDNLTEKELRDLWRENMEGHCPDVFVCKHRKMIQEAVKSLKDKNLKVNITWLMVKAYLETNMIDTFLEVDKPVGILDENILGLCTEQIDLNVRSIRRFYNLADKIVEHYSYLKEVWIPFKKILKLIDNYLTYDKNENLEAKVKAISKALLEFLDSFEIEEIVDWNNKFKEAVLKKVKFIKGTYNIMGYFIKILNENKDNPEFNDNITMDKDSSTISLFISKVEHLRNIVKRFHKLIFTDALLPTIITEITELLQIGENYAILQDTESDIIFKEVKVFKLNSNRGSYSKNTLLNFRHTDIEEIPWNTLIDLSKHIIEFEAMRDKKIGLIGSMKEFQSDRYSTNIQGELKDIIKLFKVDVRYNHYGGAAGLNKYSDVDWIILFGSYNIPLEVRRIRSRQTGIPMDKLEWIYGPGTLKQMSHRGRTVLRPDLVSLYSLTNMIKGIFRQEELFTDILNLKYKGLIGEIKRHRGVTTNFCAQYVGVSAPTIRFYLNQMAHQGILKKGRSSVQGGKMDFWYATEY